MILQVIQSFHEITPVTFNVIKSNMLFTNHSFDCRQTKKCSSFTDFTIIEPPFQKSHSVYAATWVMAFGVLQCSVIPTCQIKEILSWHNSVIFLSFKKFSCHWIIPNPLIISIPGLAYLTNCTSFCTPIHHMTHFDIQNIIIATWNFFFFDKANFSKNWFTWDCYLMTILFKFRTNRTVLESNLSRNDSMHIKSFVKKRFSVTYIGQIKSNLVSWQKWICMQAHSTGMGFFISSSWIDDLYLFISYSDWDGNFSKLTAIHFSTKNFS